MYIYTRSQFLGVCTYNHKNRELDTTRGTYNAKGSLGSNWACVKATIIGSDSYYIIFIVKPTPTTCIKVTIVGANFVHNRFEVIAIITCDNKVTVIRT